MSRRSELERPSTGAQGAARGTESLLLDALFSEAPIGLAFWDRDHRLR